MQKNNKKMTCLAAILMAALAALLIFAIVDANRINRSLSELQLNDNTVLVSTFSFNYDKNVFSKTLNLPGGLTIRYGNLQDKETGYIPFVSSVNNRNIKILATSVEALQGFFQG